MGYNKRTTFSKKSLLNQYPEYFTFVHVFPNVSFAHVAGRRCKSAVDATRATSP